MFSLHDNCTADYFYIRPKAPPMLHLFVCFWSTRELEGFRNCQEELPTELQNSSLETYEQRQRDYVHILYSLWSAPIDVLEKQWHEAQNPSRANSVSLWLPSKLLSRKDGTKTRLSQHNWTIMSLAWALSAELHRTTGTQYTSIYTLGAQVLNS